MSQYLVIKLGHDNFELRFKVRSTELAELWLERMQQRHAWPMDHPDRFYGFGTVAEEQSRAVDMIQQCIVKINQHRLIIERPFEYTQDCLNYLHNVFERYHGLLDQQTSEYWHDAPAEVRDALANLNLAVHRCETALAKPSPRFVCTWFGMPKTQQLSNATMASHGEFAVKFGTVYLNYCEIGKTVEDLTQDNDTYIAEQAFQPFKHYSADFNVAFYNKDLNEKIPSMQCYIEQHKSFFSKHNIHSIDNVNAQPLRFPVADLIHASVDDVLSKIKLRQRINSVEIE